MNDPANTPVILWDDGVGRLGPLTQTRPAHEVRTGVLTARERLEIMDIRPIVAGWDPDDGPSAVERVWPDGADEVVVLSARAVLTPAAIAGIRVGCVVVEPGSGDLVAARVRRDGVRLIGPGRENAEIEEAQGPCLIRRAWDVIRHRDAAIALDLSLLLGASQGWLRQLPPGVVVVGDRRVAIHPSAVIFPSVVIDVTGGPVVIEEGVTIRPGVILTGPVAIRAGSTVLDHAVIKANSVIGPVCKVAGEVGGTIFQGFANKGHDGHLGDSWVGEWANLGAGTVNSNLLNTYGEIVARADPGAPREKTGLVFFGSIIGDHVKTAIATRLYTGTIIGTGAMIASTAPPPASTAAFSWITDAGVSTFRFDKFIEVAGAAMGRRGRSLTGSEVASLRALHERVTATDAAGRSA